MTKSKACRLDLVKGQASRPYKRTGRHLLLIKCSTPNRRTFQHMHTVASLGLVSPGAVTDGVTLFFLEKKLTTFFSHRPLESDDLYLAVVSLALPSSHIVYPMFFVNSATNKLILFGCHSPLDGVTRGRPPSDPNDATAHTGKKKHNNTNKN